MFSNIHLEGNALLATVTTLTCLGFLLIGFDNGLMGGFVNSPAFTGTFGIDTKTNAGTNMIALIVAIYEIGCFIGAVTTSFIGEGLGRRRSVLIGVIIMVIGSWSICRFFIVCWTNTMQVLCYKRPPITFLTCLLLVWSVALAWASLIRLFLSSRLSSVQNRLVAALYACSCPP
jgi:MFS family permease